MRLGSGRYCYLEIVVIRRAFPLVLLVLALSACGASQLESESSPAASPSASATAEPSPTATPDIASVFLAHTSDDRDMVADITGSITLGEIEGEISGEVAASGRDRSQVMTIDIPGSEIQTIEQVAVGGITYVRQPSGIWLIQSGDADDSHDALAAILGGVDDLTVVGEEQWEGRTVYRMESTRAVDIGPAVLGLTDPSVTDALATIAFFASGDGTPAGLEMTATWIQGPDDARVDGRLETRFTFDQTSGRVAISAPDDAWTMYASPEYGFQMAHPVEWSVTSRPPDADFPGFDHYVGIGEAEIQVFRLPDPPPAIVPHEMFAGVGPALAEAYGAEPEHIGDLTLADGGAVRILGMEVTLDGADYYMLYAAIVSADQVWFAQWFSHPGRPAEDSARFTQFIETFAPTDA